MKEKIKKSAMSFLYRSVVCLCLFAIAFIAKRFVPQVWEKCTGVFVKNINVKVAGEHLKLFLSDILPF